MARRLYTRTDGRAEPTIAAPAMARAAQRRGAIILTQTAVRGIETTAGAVSAVVTENGPIRCNTVILAGGAWSSTFCRNLGVRIPMLMTIGSVFRTTPVPDAPERSVSGAGFAMRKRLDGGYSVSHGSISNFDIVPDSFRFFYRFSASGLDGKKNIKTHPNRQIHHRMAAEIFVVPGRDFTFRIDSDT
ncbi:MAG: hypothetical protein CM1200mP20_06710 [Pseudomonadota bacterium]|nr:MAG: hypothetical protein CM1200mP20_06710 [Pseudomonadota bacterium]